MKNSVNDSIVGVQRMLSWLENVTEWIVSYFDDGIPILKNMFV